MKKKKFETLELHKIKISNISRLLGGNGDNEGDGIGGDEEPPKRSLHCITRSCSMNGIC
ncbi:MAG: hypothetical protein AAF617_16380 [Bacteroidota bacterium]